MSADGKGGLEAETPRKNVVGLFCGAAFHDARRDAKFGSVRLMGLKEPVFPSGTSKLSPKSVKISQNEPKTGQIARSQISCAVRLRIRKRTLRPALARLQSKPQRRDVDSRDRTCMQRHWCVATRRKRAVLCCAAWCRGFLINKRRAAVVDCSIFANSRHGPGALRPFARALRNRGAQTWPFSRDRNQRHALRFFLFCRGVRD